MLEFENNQGKKLSVDACHVSAVVDRGEAGVGLRLDHPDIIVVVGLKYEEVRDQVNKAKRLAARRGGEVKWPSLAT